MSVEIGENLSWELCGDGESSDVENEYLYHPPRANDNLLPAGKPNGIETLFPCTRKRLLQGRNKPRF